MPLAPSCFSWTRCGSAKALFQMLGCRGRQNDAGKPYWQPRSVYRRQQIFDSSSTNGSDDGQITTTNAMTPKALEFAAYCVWVSLSKRTTSRPVDAVFSVMNMLNISLDPKSFRGLEFPRLAATVRLAQAYLRKGGKAYWLCHFFARDYSTCDPPMDRRMCTMMHIPEPGEVERVSEFVSRTDVESPTPIIAGCPTGSMDDQGYLKVDVPAITWTAGKELGLPEHPSKAFEADVKIIRIGESTGFKTASQGYIDQFYHYLVLGEHMPGKWHIFWSFTLENEFQADTFSTQKVAIGGPHPPSELFRSGIGA